MRVAADNRGFTIRVAMGNRGFTIKVTWPPKALLLRLSLATKSLLQGLLQVTYCCLVKPSSSCCFHFAAWAAVGRPQLSGACEASVLDNPRYPITLGGPHSSRSNYLGDPPPPPPQGGVIYS